MRKAIVAAVCVAALFALPGTAFAMSNPAGTGQPGASCEDPGMSMPAGFTTSGFANAAAQYAGSDGTGSLNSGNTHAVSQYDVACFQITSSGH
jgi:hypothetical protein